MSNHRMSKRGRPAGLWRWLLSWRRPKPDPYGAALDERVKEAWRRQAPYEYTAEDLAYMRATLTPAVAQILGLAPHG